MSYMDEYKKWLDYGGLLPELRGELSGLDEGEIRERFLTELSFGTAGLRGIMGAGTNRMNFYTVARATRGLAAAIGAAGGKERGAVVCHDCRIKSDEFAKLTAAVLANSGIRVYLFDGMRPTPELSYTLRRLGAISGVNITASHNPKEYNGYKVYWENGAQINDELAAIISGEISKADIFAPEGDWDFEKALGTGRIELLSGEADESYLSAVMEVCAVGGPYGREELGVVYTPFHGAGAEFVPRVLADAGFENVFCVEEQMRPDGAFPTVKSPNPENIEGFAMALALAKEKNAELIIGTDPDADRMGVIARNNRGEYEQITGNQTGILMSEYIINAKKSDGTLPEKAAIISTVVSSLMTKEVCGRQEVEYREAFTGFRFIAEAMAELEKEGYASLLGFEESYGYMIGEYCRDKDAVSASLMVARLAARYRDKNMGLPEAVAALYEKYGHFREETLNFIMPGVDGLAKMRELMERLRSDPPERIGAFPVLALRDYLGGVRRAGEKEPEKLKLSGSNVLIFELPCGELAVRPSGTEPKVKVYMLVRGESPEQAEGALSGCRESMGELGLNSPA